LKGIVVSLPIVASSAIDFWRHLIWYPGVRPWSILDLWTWTS
jgi:hypothetical protein